MASTSSSARDRLGDVAAGAGPDHGDDVLGGVGHRQGQELQLRRARRRTASITARPPPPGRWTSSSTTSGRAARIPATRRGDVGGLAHHDRDLPAELGPHAGPEQRVVVDEEDADRHGAASTAAGRKQADLGALARCALDLGGAAVAGHAPADRLGQAAAVAAARRRDRSPPRSRTNACIPSAVGLDVDRHVVDAGVLGGVDRRLPDRREQRLDPLVEGPVAHDHQLDRHVVQVLDLLGHERSRRSQRRVARRPAASAYSHSRSSRSWRRARRHRAAGILGAALDERQRLQHRVVQVGGHRGPLLGADALAPLVAELLAHPGQPRAEHQRRARQGEDGADRPAAQADQQPVARRRGRAAPTMQSTAPTNILSFACPPASSVATRPVGMGPHGLRRRLAR